MHKRATDITDDGDINDYGIPIGREFEPFLKSMTEMPVALLKKGDYVSGDNYPLIIHEA